jgi:predicted dehydrogenase/threonine dehydrogenase-like Zn-dependent dehydrogenase
VLEDVAAENEIERSIFKRQAFQRRHDPARQKRVHYDSLIEVYSDNLLAEASVIAFIAQRSSSGTRIKDTAVWAKCRPNHFVEPHVLVAIAVRRIKASIELPNGRIHFHGTGAYVPVEIDATRGDGARSASRVNWSTSAKCSKPIGAMKQILQSYRTGKLSVVEVPAPGVEPGSVLVQTSVSLVSVGTERMAMSLAKKSLLGKARARPDLVRKVLERVSRDGLVATGRSVIDKLDQAIPLGYSCVGHVIAVGEGISELSVGDRVACAGAKVANHAEVNLVQRNLCVRVPDGVEDESAAFVTVGAIALQGVRTAAPTLGETFAVIGLGLVGQLVAQLLHANGCRVIGIDIDARKVQLAKQLGCAVAEVRDEQLVGAVRSATRGLGVDGVIITAATDSNDPVQLAGELCRDRGRIVIVGAVRMDLPRKPYYDKELTVYQSRSYGPGRYDPIYEDMGIDYPIGYVRWTEQRNMEAFLEQCAAGRMQIAPLVTHRFPIERAEEAYQMIGAGNEALGVLITYPSGPAPARSVDIHTSSPGPDIVRIGFVGAGSFAAGVLVPAVATLRDTHLVAVASARGISARHVADRFKFDRCTTDDQALFDDPRIDAVFIATRHNLHAEQAVAALRAGKHAFVEKPLALDVATLQVVFQAQQDSGRVLMVGFNRRFAPLARKLGEFFAGRRCPLVIQYRVNAGELPPDSWIHDPGVGGGRIIGEVCHFVDFASYLADSLPISVFARGILPRGGARSDDNVLLTVAFADGSIATITYCATGDAAAGKERIEVIGDGAIGVLEDFRMLHLRRGGRERRFARLAQDKGHRAEVRAFVDAIRSGGEAPIPLASLQATHIACFAAVESLSCGRPIDIAV